MLSEEDAATQEKVEKVFRYVNVYWFGTVGPDSFSVFQAERRTNNDVESFHRWLNSRCANTRQKFWSFFSKQISANDNLYSNVNLISFSKEIRKIAPLKKWTSFLQVKRLFSDQKLQF